MGAATIFGTLVSQINEIISDTQQNTKELDQYLDAYLLIKPK
jgi:hypothetical protein